MSFEPQKLFIGLMDFFSILLPGALLTGLLMDQVDPAVLGDRYARLAGAEAWGAFLFASYLFGHLVFLLGSWLDEFYDRARRHSLNAQITRLARRGRLLPWLARALIWLVFKGERNLAVERAGKIKQQALGALRAGDAINAFQWSKAWLTAENPASLAVVQRFEADAKFFRCFTVVLLLLLIGWPWHQQWPLTGIPVVLLLLLLALWRYMEQRFKATNQAYWSVITLTARDGTLVLNEAAPAAGVPTHAGGVVSRMQSGRAEYLLVEAKDDPTQWVLPEGHVEEAEHPHETAIREVHEETGVWAVIGVVRTGPARRGRVANQERQEEERRHRRIAADLGTVTYTVNATPVAVRYFLMEAVGRGLRKDKDRQHRWLPLQEAIATASHPESGELLRTADRRRAAIKDAAAPIETAPTPTTDD